LPTRKAAFVSQDSRRLPDNVLFEGGAGEALRRRLLADIELSFPYDELIARDKANLDVTWLRDESLEEANLPAPEVIAREIVEDLIAAAKEPA